MAIYTTETATEATQVELPYGNWFGDSPQPANLGKVAGARWYSLPLYVRLSMLVGAAGLCALAWVGLMGLPSVLIPVVAFWLWYRHGDRSRLYSFSGSFEQFLDRQGHIVRLRLHRRGLVYGDDAGTIRFESGWFIFDGLTTDFRFPVNVILAAGPGLPAKLDNQWPEAHHVVVGSMEEPIFIEFEPLHPPDREHSERELLVSDLERWLHSRVTRNQPLMLPPNRLAPSVRPQRMGEAVTKISIYVGAGLLLIVSATGKQMRSPADMDPVALSEFFTAAFLIVSAAIVLDRFKFWEKALRRRNLLISALPTPAPIEEVVTGEIDVERSGS